MNKNYPGEQWKIVQFDFEFTNDCRIEVSNFGRVRTFNKISDGNVIKGSMINGYRIIRLKFYQPRDERAQATLSKLQQQVLKLSGKLKQQKTNQESIEAIDETVAKLDSLKKSVSKKFKKDLKDRTINYHSLIHRLVAEYFLPPPTSEQTIVAHLDHDKLHNKVSNLKWMTPEENYQHQRSSPNVIEDHQHRQERQQSNPNRAKLTVTRVMLLKKLLNEGKPMKQLVKLFKVTNTQITRIKRGENWGNIQASK